MGSANHPGYFLAAHARCERLAAHGTADTLLSVGPLPCFT